MLIDIDVLPCLAIILRTDTSSCKKHACRVISFITMDGENNIQAIIEANIIPTLVEFLHNGDSEIMELAIS